MTLPHDEALHPRGAGGQWTEKNHAEPAGVSLDRNCTELGSGEVLGIAEQWRDSERRLRDESFVGFEMENQRLALKLLGTALKEQYPDAATLVVHKNVDGERQLDVHALWDKDGNVLREVTMDDDGDFSEDLMFDGGPSAQDVLYSVNPLSREWAEGIATEVKAKPFGFTEDAIAIDLEKAAAMPVIPEAAPPAAYDPEHHQAISDKLRRNFLAMNKLREENNKLNMAGAFSSVLRDFPDAKELRVRMMGGGRGGSPLSAGASSVHLKDGTVKWVNDGDWHYNSAEPGHPSLATFLSEVSASYWYEENGYTHDPETNETVIPIPGN